MIAVYLHDLDPFAIRFLGGDGPLAGIRWYGLSYLAGFLFAWWVFRRLAAAGGSTLRREDATDLILTLALGALIGGRIGYVLFYRPELLGLVDHPPYWGLLALHDGGMASHGGIAGVVLAAWLWARRRGHRLGHVIDLAALAAPMGICFGRLANFVNGELYGRAVSESFPLAVRFPQELFELSSDPYASARMTEVLTRARVVTGGEVSGRVATIVEAMRLGDPEVVEAMTPLLTPRHPSQVYQALLEGLLVFVFLVWLWRRPQRPWMVAGGFGVSYAIARIVGEFFREPDAHLKAQEFALLHATRGQLLSVAILLIGTAVMVYAARSDAPAMGSWRRRSERLPPEAWPSSKGKGAADERRLPVESGSDSSDQKR